MKPAIAELDPMAPATQIRVAIEEGMENIFRAIFGEGNTTTTTYELLPEVVSGQQTAVAKTVCTKGDAINCFVTAHVPIAHPNQEHGNYCIAEKFFSATAHDTMVEMSYEAWCENNPNLGAKVLVEQRMVHDTVWIIADSMECEVVYRGPFAGMPAWAKEIVDKREDVLAIARRHLRGYPDGDG